MNWRDVNGDAYEYLIGKGPNGDVFVKTVDGECIKRKKEIKMTREEAYSKMQNSQAGGPMNRPDIPFSKLCDYLEALGLIKFEEEKKNMYNIVVDEKAASEFRASGYYVELRK